MKTVKEIREIREILDISGKENKKIGLVPTMGALHNGHLSLIRRAAAENDLLVVSIFVNPTQFNDKSDLERYPRNLEADLALLEQLPVDLVFAPSEQEMYPEPDTRIFSLAPLDTVMEGKFRPGHFNGVAQIVSKLFTIIEPHHAYFGLKDFQQLAVIRRLTGLLNLPVTIVGCPIIRDADGLAMSSRNQLLTPEEREASPLIYRTLVESIRQASKVSPAALKRWVENRINDHPLMQIEYFEIVDDQNLMPVHSWDEQVNKVGCIAVYLGKVRLIDNIFFLNFAR